MGRKLTAPEASLPKVALLCRCPGCGRGKLFKGMLDVAERCEACGLDLSAQDADDGPAVFVILILGAVVVGLAFLVEAKIGPPLWVHAVIWPPLIVVASLALLRPLKAGLIALQYRHRSLQR